MLCFPSAKINIGLHVKDLRADGYHEIESLLYPILWEEVLEFVEAKKTQLFCTGLSVDTGQNLVLKAYTLLQKKYPLRPLKIYLHKSIPLGAGLGGGSSDAARMLCMLVKYFKLPVSKEELYNYALVLGSDVPFFLENKPTWVGGRGDILRSSSHFLKGMWIVVAVPKNVSVSTKKAYANLKNVKQIRPNLERIVDIPRKDWMKEVRNEFQTSVFSQYKVLLSIDNLLRQLGAWYRSLSGTGSAVYGLFEAPPVTLPKAKSLAARFQELNCYYWIGKLS